MKLLVGLGNPGERYQLSRHNAGFMFIDYLAEKLKLDEPLAEKEKFKSVVGRKRDWWLAKPTTYMNQSGEAVGNLVNFYKVKLDDLVVIHDDLDLLLGSWKLQQGVGPKIHNGLTSVETSLGKPAFWRLRLGVDNRTPQIKASTSGEEYVLAKFPTAEQQQLESVFPPAWAALAEMLG